MNVLILGSGGREHALGWKIAQSTRLSQLFFSPGNPGTADYGENVVLTNSKEVVRFCLDQSIDLVVPGPEDWLIDGIVDDLEKAGIHAFGPGKAAAMLEGSKVFAKQIMLKAQIPTAGYTEFTEARKALQFIETAAFPLVIKADGLAAGKGVSICQNLKEAQKAIDSTMIERKFGSAGEKIIVEEFLTGTEASFHLICDGTRAVSLVSAQDHKALHDGNAGPNTGGMGTFAPSPMVTPKMEQTLLREIAEPVLNTMQKEGIPFKGVLFIGLMLTYHGPRVLEFNVRFGDPETQVMMPLLEEDLLDLLFKAATGTMEPGKKGTLTKPGSAVCVIMASKGYPETAEKGKEIRLPSKGLVDQIVFHAGTRRDENNRLLTSGGRVLGVTAWSPSLEKAREHAYEAVKHTHFEGSHYRNDIGGKS